MTTTSESSESAQPVAVAPLSEGLGPVAEVKCGRLQWAIPRDDYRLPLRFLNNDTHPLYDQAALDAAVAAECERYAPLMQAVEWLLDDGHMDTLHLARLRAAFERAQRSR